MEINDGVYTSNFQFLRTQRQRSKEKEKANADVRCNSCFKVAVHASDVL